MLKLYGIVDSRGDCLPFGDTFWKYDERKNDIFFLSASVFET